MVKDSNQISEGLAMNNLISHRNSFLIRFVLSILVFIAFTSNPAFVLADEPTNSLSVKLLPSDYQTATNAISLTPEANKTYSFDIELANQGDDGAAIQLTAYPSTALSNGSNVVFTSNKDNLLDDTFDFTKYVTLQSDDLSESNQMTLEPNEAKVLSFTIVVPASTNISGELLGGINISQQTDFQASDDSVGIQSVFERIITVRLDFGGDRQIKDLVYQNFSFTATTDLVSLNFEAYNYNSFLGNLNNASYELKNPNDEIIASGEFSDSVPITAMSIVPLTFPLNNTAELLTGKYKLTIETERKSISTSFNYAKEDLDNLKKETQESNNVLIHSDNNKLLILIIVVLSLTLIASGWYIIKTNKRNLK